MNPAETMPISHRLRVIDLHKPGSRSEINVRAYEGSPEATWVDVTVFTSLASGHSRTRRYPSSFTTFLAFEKWLGSYLAKKTAAGFVIEEVRP